MSIQNKQAIVVQKRTITDLIGSEKVRSEIAKVLPKHLTPERMTRVALTATMRNPDLLNCTPESLLNSLLVCSQAGLEPDGRLAHLIPYGNVCQVIFDYKGLVTLMRRSGAETVYADKVCEYDDFDAWVEDGKKKLSHRVNWKKARGTPYLFYAVVVQEGVLDYEVMTMEEVEDIRKRSKASSKGPWVTDFDEMAKKCPLRRISKRFDLLPEIRDVINAEDDTLPPLNIAPVARPVFAPRQELPEPAPESPEPPPAAAPAKDATPQPEAPTPEPVPATPPAPAPDGSGYNPLKGVRGLCKMSRVKEGEVLAQLYRDGTTDGSASTLEEVALMPNGKDILKALADSWPDFVARMGEQKGD